ncbi:unnamed protein product, partial [Anisakis simplex]|uniref:Myosin N-terminal SH3-like domain-containing protein n=1 Tax=Anisakis simplex TaxID=6269 RepID=A0A0M3KIQ5_ANISI
MNRKKKNFANLPSLERSLKTAIWDSTEQSKPYDSKKDCWIPDAEEGFIKAQIKGTQGDVVDVVTGRGNELKIKSELIQEMNPPKFEKTEDMSNLTFLNDA